MVSRLAKNDGVPVVYVVGGYDSDLDAVYLDGVSSIFSINRLPEPLEVSGPKTARTLPLPAQHPAAYQALSNAGITKAERTQNLAAHCVLVVKKRGENTPGLFSYPCLSGDYFTCCFSLCHQRGKRDEGDCHGNNYIDCCVAMCRLFVGGCIVGSEHVLVVSR